MFITGVGSAAPEHRYSQEECWKAIQNSPCLSKLGGRSQAILRKVLTSDNGIRTRHFAMSSLEEAFCLDPNTLHARFVNHAPGLAAAAARKAMVAAGLESGKVDALIISTCTGYLCPGLTSYVSEQLGLPRDILLLDLVGHGCGAALPNLQTGAALLRSGQAENVLSVCVEICSAAFYLDNDPGVLISACLFGDGAGAAVLSKSAGANRAVRWTKFASVLNPEDRQLLRFEQRDGMLRNILDKSVPFLVVEHVRQVFARLASQAGLDKKNITEWILHSGGRDVLAAIKTGLQLSDEQLRWSSEVLNEYGNVSSPSVLFALERALRANAPGGRWFLSAFGAGITCHGAILEVE